MNQDKIPPEVLNYFRQQGALGGRKAAEGMTPEQRRERALKAVSAREQKRAAGELSPRPAPATPPGPGPAPPLRCKRCAYGWTSRTGSEPAQCPKCGARKWWMTEDEAAEARAIRQRTKLVDNRPTFECQWCSTPNYSIGANLRHEIPCKKREIKAYRQAYGLKANNFEVAVVNRQIIDCEESRRWIALVDRPGLIDFLVAPEDYQPPKYETSISRFNERNLKLLGIVPGIDPKENA